MSRVERCSVCGSLSTPPIAPTIVTSSPSRIQVMPSEMITTQCHLLQGRRSILLGMLVLTALAIITLVSDPTLLLIVFIVSRLLCSSPCCSDYAYLFAHFSDWWLLQSILQKNVAYTNTICRSMVLYYLLHATTYLLLPHLPGECSFGMLL